MDNTNTTKEAISIKSGVKALVSIRDFENTKLEYQLQLKEIEASINDMSETASAIIKSRNGSKMMEESETLLREISESADSLHKTLVAINQALEGL